jgi:hypothetical protein
MPNLCAPGDLQDTEVIRRQFTPAPLSTFLSGQR